MINYVNFQRFLDLANSRILPELPPISSSPPSKTRRQKAPQREAASLNQASNMDSVRKTAFPAARQSNLSNASLRATNKKNKRQIFILQFSYKNYLDENRNRNSR